MPIFQPKNGPVLTWGRLLHFAESFVFVTLSGFLFGIDGVAFGSMIAITLGFGWEVLNHWWPTGYHMFGDLVDWYAFVAGAIGGAVLIHIASSAVA